MKYEYFNLTTPFTKFLCHSSHLNHFIIGGDYVSAGLTINTFSKQNCHNFSINCQKIKKETKRTISFYRLHFSLSRFFDFLCHYKMRQVFRFLRQIFRELIFIFFYFIDSFNSRNVFITRAHVSCSVFTLHPKDIWWGRINAIASL